MPLSAPQQSGDILKPADIENHTLIVTPVEYIPHLPNVNTKAGEMSPAIRCNVVDLATPDNIPAVYNGVLWFNQMLHSNLKRQIGETILGRMVKGTATPGKNAPFQLQDVMSEAAWVQHAEAWLATAEGQAYEVQAINDVNHASDQSQVAANTPQASAPVPAPAAPSVPATPAPPSFPTGPVGVSAPSAPPAAPVSPAPAAPAGATPDLAALLASLPAEQQAAVLANLQNQGQASS